MLTHMTGLELSLTSLPLSLALSLSICLSPPRAPSQRQHRTSFERRRRHINIAGTSGAGAYLALRLYGYTAIRIYGYTRINIAGTSGAGERSDEGLV